MYFTETFLEMCVKVTAGQNELISISLGSYRIKRILKGN